MNQYITTIELDKICPDELFDLKREIDEYHNAFCAAEEAYCSGDEATSDIRNAVSQKALKLKKRIRVLAIGWGIHQESLQDYAAVSAKCVDAPPITEPSLLPLVA
jgi:hypothetical protein